MGVDPRAFEGVELTFVGPSALSASGADVVLVDADAFDGVAELALARKGVQAPVLVRAKAADVDELVDALPESDEICLKETPQSLLARRVRQLASKAAESLDGLTGVFNRHVLLKQVEERLKECADERPVSVLIVDVDLFKAINEECGHGVGDEILKEVAKRCAQVAGATGAVGRLGGEEFCVVVDADEAACVDVAHAIRAMVSDALMPMAIRVTVSVGAATTRQPAPSSELLRRADEALYAAKARGNDQAAHWSELEREALAADQDVGLSAFENLTRVISERVAHVIAQRGRRLFRELRQEADLDGLTGLYNRRYLDRRLQWEFEEATRAAQPLAIALFDVDFFGQVNKDHGWPTGDLVLREIATMVKQRGAARGWAARYGGEELCLVMPGSTTADAVALLEDVRELVGRKPFPTPTGGTFRVTTSCGVAEKQAGDGSVQDVVARVSDRLLAAKRDGRDCVRS